MSSDMKKALKKAKEAKQEKKVTERAAKVSAEERQRKREEYDLKRATENIERRHAFVEPLKKSQLTRESFLSSERERYEWLMELAKKNVRKDFEKEEYGLFNNLALFLFDQHQLVAFLESLGLMKMEKNVDYTSEAMKKFASSLNKPTMKISDMDFLARENNVVLEMLHFIRNHPGLVRVYERGSLQGFLAEEKERFEFLNRFKDISKEDKAELIQSFAYESGQLQDDRVNMVNLSKILKKYRSIDAFLEQYNHKNIVMEMVTFIRDHLKEEFNDYNKENKIDLEEIVQEEEKRMNGLKENGRSISESIALERESFDQLKKQFLSEHENKVLDSAIHRGNAPPFDYAKEYIKEESARLELLEKLIVATTKEERKQLIDSFVSDSFSQKDYQEYRFNFINLAKVLRKYDAIHLFMDTVDKEVTVQTNLVMSMIDFIQSNLAAQLEEYNRKLDDPIKLKQIKKEEQKRIDRVIAKTRNVVSTEFAREWDELFEDDYVTSDKLRQFVPIKGEHAPPRDDTIVYTKTVRDCLKDYRNKPWIYKYNGRMYIRVVEGDMFEGYFLPERVEWKSKTYQRVTPSFDLLLCNAVNKQQKGDVLSFRSKDKEFKIEILYGLNPDDDMEPFLLQGEDLYDEEKGWIRSQEVANANYLGQFMWSPLSKYEERIRSSIRDRIEGKTTVDGVIHRHFQRVDAVKIEKAIFEQLKAETKYFVTIRDYLERVAYLMIFLDENYLKKDAVTFINRLESLYYNADSISQLTVEDIFPEIYGKGDPESIRYLNKKIDDEVRAYVMIEGRTLEAMINHRPFSNMIRAFRVGTVYSHTEMLTKSDCINKEDVMNERSWDIVYYKEGEDVYCFKLIDLVEQFSKGEYINPKTGKEFNEDFIANIETTYKIPPKGEKIVEEVKVVDTNPLLEAFFEVERGLKGDVKAHYDKIFEGDIAPFVPPVKDDGMEQYNANVHFDIPSAQHTLQAQLYELRRIVPRTDEIQRQIRLRRQQISNLEKMRINM